MEEVADLRKQLADAGAKPVSREHYVYLAVYPYERDALKNLVQLATVDTGQRATYGSAVIWAQHIVQNYLDQKNKEKE